MGDYDEYNVDRVDELETALEKARGKYDTEQEYLDMTTRLRQELEDRREYVDRSGAGGDIQPDATDLDIATGVLTGDGAAAEAAPDLNLQEALDRAQGVETGDAAEAERIAAEDRAAELQETLEAYKDPIMDMPPAETEAERRAKIQAAANAEQRRQQAVARHGGDGGGGGGQAAADLAGGSWGSSPFRKGGRVGYGKGGIVDLLK